MSGPTPDELAWAEEQFTPGIRLLEDVRAFIRRYIVVSGEAADFLALWVTHTHCFEAAVTTPYVRVVSAERASGKTRLLEVLSVLVRRGWLELNPSAAVVYRKGDKEAPTLLLDEVDNVAFADRRDLLSVLNGGYRLGAKVSRCTDKGELLDFDCFYPKTFAGIDDGKLPDTLISRSVPVRMERRRPDEQIEKWRIYHGDLAAEPLRGRLAEWSADNLDALADAEPEEPEELNDREAEGWEPLFAIADLVGGTWPTRARHAAITLAKSKAEHDESRGVKLLRDIRRVFAKKGNREAIFSADLAAALNTLEESEWGGWNDGEGIKPRELAKHLRPYKIHPYPKTLRIGEAVGRGYYRASFDDAWARYTVTSVTSVTHRFGEPNQDVTVVADVTEVTDVTGDPDSQPDYRRDELDWGDGDV
jgi:hypothetical protein